MVRCTMSLRTGSGGVLCHMIVQLGTACITLTVVYILATAAATLGATSAVSRPPKV